jgi:hypothetical protein
MATPAEALRQQVGWIIVALILFAGVLAHALLPRYETHVFNVTPDTHVLVVYDKWSNRYQRASFDANGKIHLSDVYVTP